MKDRLLILVLICAVVGLVLATWLAGSRRGTAGSMSGIGTGKTESIPTSGTKTGKTTSPVKNVATQPDYRDILLKQTAGFKMSDAVITVMGLNPEKKDYNARAKAMKALTRRLSADDVQALMLFLDSKIDTQKDLKPLEFNSIKNDVLDVLLKQDKMPDGLARQVVAMYQDNRQDDVWRDYCVQYLGACYEAQSAKSPASFGNFRLRQSATAGQVAAASMAHGAGREEIKHKGTKDTKGKEEERKSEQVGDSPTNQVAELGAIRDAYWDALGEKNKTIAGTALIGMEALSRTHPEFDREKIGSSAESLALDDTCGEAARITALRICGGMGRSNVLATARILAQTADTVPLRMAAMATVADLGDKSDMELLQSLSASSEKRVAGLATNVLGKMRGRLTLRR